MVTLLARLDAEHGALGRHLDGRPDRHGARLAAGTPIARLVLNDVGPTIEPAAIARIGAYLGLPLDWTSEEEAADYLLGISQGFGPHSREQWLALTRPMLRRDGDSVRPHYDPAIAVPFRAVTPAAAARARRRCGRPTTRSAARRWCCAAPSPTSSRARLRRP